MRRNYNQLLLVEGRVRTHFGVGPKLLEVDFLSQHFGLEHFVQRLFRIIFKNVLVYYLLLAFAGDPKR